MLRSHFLAELSWRQLLVLVLRVFTFLTIIAVIICLTAGTLSNPLHIYIHKLEFSQYDVARGLYDALTSNANNLDTSSADDIYGSGFSTSEIQILVDYASDEFQDSPQFLVSSIWNYCLGTFSSISLSKDNLAMNVPSRHTNTRLISCSKSSDYYLNYRSLLGQNGLTIILEYAYNGNYQDYGNYDNLMDRVRSVSKLFPNCLLFITVSQIIMFLLLIALYLIFYQKSKNHTKEKSNQLHLFLEHFISILSFACFVAVLVATITLVIVSFTLKSTVATELGDFGITLHLGRIYFTLLWFLVAMIALNFSVWGGIAWCTVPDGNLNEDKYFTTRHRNSIQSIQMMNQVLSENGYNTTSYKSGYEDELTNDFTLVTGSNLNSPFYNSNGTPSSRNFSPQFSTSKTLNSIKRSQTSTTHKTNYFMDPPSTSSKKNLFVNNENGLKQSNSSSDLVSMVDNDDPYVNDVDYDQVLHQNGLFNSGFGLSKNGTVKDGLLAREDSSRSYKTNPFDDVEQGFHQKFSTVEQYGYGSSNSKNWR